MKDTEKLNFDVIDYKSFGTKIKNLRIEKNLTQEELAVKIDRTRNYISKLESNNTFVSLEAIALLSRALNVSVDYLLFESIELEQSENDIIIENYLKYFSEKEKLFLIDLIKAIYKHNIE